MHFQAYTLLPFILSTASVYALPQGTSSVPQATSSAPATVSATSGRAVPTPETTAPAPAQTSSPGLKSSKTILHPQATASSSPVTCEDRRATIPISDLQAINLKLDALGAGGNQCCAPTTSNNGSSTALIPCSSTDSGNTVVFIEYTGSTTIPDSVLCIGDAELANYVVDWTSPDLDKECLVNKTTVYPPVQPVWQVPGLNVLARTGVPKPASRRV